MIGSHLYNSPWKARRDTAMERAKEMEAARDAVADDCERAENALANARNQLAIAQQSAGEAMRNAERFARRGNQHRERRIANARRALSYRANMHAMRQTAAESTAGLAQAITERNAARAELASLQRSLADPSNPIRATDAVRLMDEARELRAKVASLTAHNAQMKAMCERGSDQLEQMIGRVTRAESILRHAGLMAAPIVVEAPGAIAA